MYAKLINNTIKPAPNKVRCNGSIIFNPPQDVLAALGYLPVTYTDPPDNPPDGYYYESSWMKSDTAITQVWHLEEDPEIPDPEPTMYDLMEAVERGLKA